MDLAHDLFHADSRHLLDHLRQARTDHRRELGLLLGSVLMRAAGQDWYEQGDVWARVAAHRPTSQPPSDIAAEGVHRLITARADSAYSPLTAAPGWSAAFHRAGQRLTELAHQGGLTRGLRAVLAHHILFAWNRAGISGQQQALLAATAARVVFDSEPTRTQGLAAPSATRLSAVTTNTTIGDPERLRAGLVDYIRRRGTFRTPQVEAAFLAAQRHLFLPGVDLETAYSPEVRRDQTC